MAIAEQDLAEELGVKLSQQQQERLRDAASRAGMSLSEFAAAALVRAADDVLEQPQPTVQPETVLSERDFDYLVQFLEADAAPNDALQAAADDYKRRRADGSLQVEN